MKIIAPKRLMASIFPTVRNVSIFNASSLDLQFARTKTLDPRVTFTRDSSGIYVDSDGLIKTATANEPRFDHNPTTGESLGLLMEEQRTNLLLQSEGFSTTWSQVRATILNNTETAPDGSTTADTITDSVDSSSTTHIVQQSISWTSGTAYSVSCWFKAGTLQEAGFVFPSAQFDSALCRFSLITGNVLQQSGVTASTEKYPNGWWRCRAVATATATGSGFIQLRPMNGSTSYQGNGAGTVFAWGAQLEAGAFPTSYIPTTTATVTRSADVASITGANFSSWYRQNEGTVFIEGVMAPNLSRFAPELALSDGTDTNKIEFYNYPSGYGSTVRASGQTNTDPILILSPTSGLPYKKAIALKANDYRVAAQGQQGTSANPSFIPTVNELNVGTSRGGTTSIGSTIRRLTYWPTRLSNNTLQQITQP